MSIAAPSNEKSPDKPKRAKRQGQCLDSDIIDLAQSNLAVTVANWPNEQVKLANVTMPSSGKTLLHMYAAYGSPREMMLFRLELSSSSFW
jgi:hypothetical protein